MYSTGVIYNPMVLTLNFLISRIPPSPCTCPSHSDSPRFSHCRFVNPLPFNPPSPSVVSFPHWVPSITPTHLTYCISYSLPQLVPSVHLTSLNWFPFSSSLLSSACSLLCLHMTIQSLSPTWLNPPISSHCLSVSTENPPAPVSQLHLSAPFGHHPTSSHSPITSTVPTSSHCLSPLSTFSLNESLAPPKCLSSQLPS